MNSFLHNIATELLREHDGDMHDVTIVFPNKRAALFLNRLLAELSDRPIWSPQYTTISELFRSMSSLEIGDRILLVSELHKSYCKVTGKQESLEQFYGWGELMLSDFDDIDKHLRDAKQIFSLLSDIHQLDSIDYLTQEKIAALQQFFSNFSKDHNTVLKQRFLELWNRFYDIYTDYRQSLLAQGIAYEGMMYREVIENLNLNDNLNYVFVGFNLMTPVEQLLVTKVGGKVINDDDNSCPPKQLTFLSSPTNDLQARYITQWLTPERIKAGRRTAIVLADESLLETVLHCLPPGLCLNITTGYPLAQASITSLIKAVATLLLKNSYTLHNINGVLRHPLMKYISDKQAELHNDLNSKKIYYLTADEISVDDNLRHLFAPLKDREDVTALIERLIWVTKTIAKADRHDALTTESLYRMYTLLNRLQTLISENGIELTMTMFGKLLQQVIQSTTIPFHGEPIEGIQIMGVLETRNLDFDHVLLLSCNEGMLPAKVNDSSFIPHSIRMAHGLTTIDNKVAIYHYYFDRLLQRADDVTIVYNNAVNDGKASEMSRFMLQLIAQDTIPIKRGALEADVDVTTNNISDIKKTPDMIRKLLEHKFLSPSALGKYLRCPARFYYTYVEDIRDDNESDEEEIDYAVFGRIFHKAAELLYSDFQGKVVPPEYIPRLLREKGHPTLRRIAEQAFRGILFNIGDTQRKTPKLGGLQVINFEMVVTFLIHLLRYDHTLTRLQIVGLEKTVYGTVPVNTANGTINVNIGGTIDRLDMVNEKDGIRRLRVIDYKTGRLSRPLNINEIKDIFDPTKIDYHTDYFLQALLYAYIINEDDNFVRNATLRNGASAYENENGLPIATGLLYVQSATKEEYSPLLSIAGTPIYDATQHLEDFREGLSQLIGEILNTDIPFRLTNNVRHCEQCPYYNFCH
jgi:hypothetical protein